MSDTFTETNHRRLELRGRDAVADLFERRLSLPEVYFEARWSGEPEDAVDVIAIDRAGVGDVHVVEIEGSPEPDVAAIRQLIAVSNAHFRWLAFFPKGDVAAELPAWRGDLFPDDEMGRVGLIGIERTANDDLAARILVKAERFRGPPRAARSAFRESNEPDLESGF